MTEKLDKNAHPIERRVNAQVWQAARVGYAAMNAACFIGIDVEWKEIPLHTRRDLVEAATLFRTAFLANRVTSITQGLQACQKRALPVSYVFAYAVVGFYLERGLQ